MLAFKKEKQVRKLILSHLAAVDECLLESCEVLKEYISGHPDGARDRVNKVIEIESRADNLEREIRDVLLQGAFLPHIRSDVYRLVESVDSIAGKAEDIARFVVDQTPLVPEEFQQPLLEIYQLSLECFAQLRKALRQYFKPKGKLENLHEHVNRVCEIETEVDAKESVLAREVFATALGLAEKVHIEQLVTRIGNLADLSEDAADELDFAAMKSVV